MMQEKDTVLEVKNLYKLFGPYDFLDERKAAFKLLELGASRMDVMETTGIMAAISDVSFSVKRGELLYLSVYQAVVNQLSYAALICCISRQRAKF